MNRNEFVHQLTNRLTLPQQEQVNIQDWWWIHSDRNNWRLTWQGYNDFKNLFQLQSWEFDFESHDIRPWVYLKLSRNLKVPFFIVDNKKHNKLILFDSKSAVMINLYGNLIKWISTLN